MTGPTTSSLGEKHWASAHAVDPNSVYVNRPHDHELLDALAGQLVTLIQGSRMSGKSSLLMRTRLRLGDIGGADRLDDIPLPKGLVPDELVIAYCDLTAINAPSATGLARTIIRELEDRAGVAWTSTAVRDTDSTADRILQDGLERLKSALESNGRSLSHAIVMLDEMDALEHWQWADEFFAAIARLRARAYEGGGLGCLRIVLSGVKPLRFIVRDTTSDAHIVPDVTLWLDDFSNNDASIRELAEGFPPGMSEHALGLAGKAIEYTGGYPQACIWLCNQMARHGITTDQRSGDLDNRIAGLVDRMRTDVDYPIFLSYPKEFLLYYSLRKASVADEDPALSVINALANYRQLLAKKEIAFSAIRPEVALLCWAGLAQRDHRGALTVRGKLLRRHYTSDWARDLSQDLSSHVLSAQRQTRTKTKLKTVVVFTTGGTIGMVADEKGMIQAETAGSAYADAQSVANVEFSRLFSHDSANVVPEDWETIARNVAEVVRDDKVAGVVVAHGTDTLAYTASAVAFALGRNLSKPVVFTGSQAPVTVRYADAAVNVARACKLAADGRLPEVTICFGDTVLRACQAQKRDDRRFDGFESPFGPPLAIITEEIYYNERVFRPGWNAAKDSLDLRWFFDTRILSITQVPGLRPDLLIPVLESGVNSGVSGIVIQSLGAGNLPTRDEYSLVDFIERAVTIYEVPVVVGSLYPVRTQNADLYQPSRAAHDKGAIRAFNMTLPAIVTKLAWILGQYMMEEEAGGAIQYVEKRMLKDAIGEVTDFTYHT